MFDLLIKFFQRLADSAAVIDNLVSFMLGG